MCRNLDKDSPIYEHVRQLRFMNLLVGHDDVTADKDFKHIFKRQQNLMMRNKGIFIQGFCITPVTGVDPITIRRSLIPSSLRPLSSQDEVEWKRRREFECIDSATGQETQLAVLGTTERALYTVQGIRNVLHYDALEKEPESYGSVKKLRETGGMHRPELDGNSWRQMEYAGNYYIVQGPGLG